MYPLTGARLRGARGVFGSFPPCESGHVGLFDTREGPDFHDFPPPGRRGPNTHADSKPTIKASYFGAVSRVLARNYRASADAGGIIDIIISLGIVPYVWASFKELHLRCTCC